MSRLINETRKIKTLEKNIVTNGTKKQVICNKRWEKTHKAIKIYNVILENQRMKIFLT